MRKYKYDVTFYFQKFKMKINDIKTVLSFTQVLESASPQATDLIFESAAEMVRNIRTVLSQDKIPSEAINDSWDTEKIAQFCTALERIEKVVNTQLSNNTIKPELRDTVFTILATSDFNHEKAINLILKQAANQHERIAFWTELLSNTEKKQELQNALDQIARSLSALVSLMRTKGAAEMQSLKNDQQSAAVAAAKQVDPIV